MVRPMASHSRVVWNASREDHEFLHDSHRKRRDIRRIQKILDKWISPFLTESIAWAIATGSPIDVDSISLDVAERLIKAAGTP